MKIREILTESAKLLGEEEVAKSLTENIENAGDEINRKIHALLTSYNAVQDEIALNYQLPERSITVSGKKISAESFIPSPIKIIGVYDADGDKVDFTYNGKTVESDEVMRSIKYGYIPDDKGLDDEFDMQGKLISKRAVCYGIASEFCLKEGRYEESVNWESRYRQSLDVKKDYSKIRIKAGRRWGL